MPRTRLREQLMLFSPDVVPLRALVYQARLQNIRLKAKNIDAAKGLEAAVDNLTRAMDAILNADPISLRLAGITPPMAIELAYRLQSAAGALIVRR